MRHSRISASIAASWGSDEPSDDARTVPEPRKSTADRLTAVWLAGSPRGEVGALPGAELSLLRGEVGTAVLVNWSAGTVTCRLPLRKLTDVGDSLPAPGVGPEADAILRPDSPRRSGIGSVGTELPRLLTIVCDRKSCTLEAPLCARGDVGAGADASAWARSDCGTGGRGDRGTGAGTGGDSSGDWAVSALVGVGARFMSSRLFATEERSRWHEDPGEENSAACIK